MFDTIFCWGHGSGKVFHWGCSLDEIEFVDPSGHVIGELAVQKVAESRAKIRVWLTAAAESALAKLKHMKLPAAQVEFKQQSAPTPCDAATFHGLSAKDLGRGVAGTQKSIQFLQDLPKLFEKATCTTKHGQSSVPCVELCHRIPIFFESAMQCKPRDYGRHVHEKLAQLLPIYIESAMQRKPRDYGRHVHEKLAQLLPDSDAAKAAKELKMLAMAALENTPRMLPLSS